MKGLEVTELLLSDVRRENLKLRLDSGYFSKPMLDADSIVSNYPSGKVDLGSLFSRFVKGIFDINANSYSEEGVPFLRILNLRHGVIDENNITYIYEAIHKKEIKTELHRGDIVLSKTAYPAASLVTLEKCNTSQDTIATKFSDFGARNFCAEAVVAYLNSRIGQQLLWRQFQGNVQLHLSLDDGRKVPIPRFGDQLQAAVTKAFNQSEMERKSSLHQLELAEKALEKTLNLKGTKDSDPLTYARNCSVAFSAGRLDAEYFSPHVADVLKTLGKDGLTIADVAPAIHEKFKSDEAGDTFNYIEIGNVRSDGSVQANEIPTVEAPSRATQHVRTGDVITSTVRPIRRLSALITSEQDRAVCSSGFVVLQPKAISGATLLTYLRLPLFCELMDLHTSASMYPAISEKDLLSLPIPKIPEATQREIDKHIEDSFTSKQRAIQLMDTAKRAVEIAIEQDEQTASKWLTNETKKIQI